MESNTLSRRHAFKLAGLAGAAVALRDTRVFAETPAAAPATLPQGAGFYRTHVGELEVTIVSDGSFPLTPYPTFGANASEEAVNNLLNDNFLDPAKLMGQVNAVVVRKAGGPVTLIDTGCGKLFGPAAGFALQNLAAAGVKPDDVRHVLFTHLHPDHAGGAVTDGRKTFPNATHHVSEQEASFWTSAQPDFSKSGVPADFQPVMIETARNVIKVLEPKRFAPGSELLPGILPRLTVGHTPGHCVVTIQDGGQSLVYLGDMVIHHVLVPAHPEWFVGFDTDREMAVTARQTLLADLAQSRSLVSGSHLPFPSLGHFKKADAGYAYVPAPWRWA
ncbi:MAG TPA: MBL fold metallo-hydrolase [Tepidisphaeraceae bacterium]|jgi:glyoxylase-like metal-dependent hydrolase (beta-lactamase superfamily II)